MNKPRGNALITNEYLETGDYLYFDYGMLGVKSFFIMQGDGNVCWYKGTGPADNQGLIWAPSHPHGDGDYFLVMQGDGNVCAYRGTGPADNKGLVWETATPQGIGDYFLALAWSNPTFGVGGSPLPGLILYSGTPNSSSPTVIWSQTTTV